MTLEEACRRALLVGLLSLAGCHGQPAAPPAPAQPFHGIQLTVGALGDRMILETVNAQRGEWEERQGTKVAIKPELAATDALAGLDVVLFPGDRLGELVDRRALFVIPEAAVRPPVSAAGPPPASNADPVSFADVIPTFRDQVTKYGDDRFGMPYGGSGLVLVYRRDALEGKANVEAAKEAKIALGLPKTWEQLDALAKFLHGRDSDGDGEPESGIAVAWGTDPEGLGDATFLSRAGALGQHHDQFSFLFDASTMEPRIASPPFVEALAGLVALTAFGPAQAKTLDAEAARAAFRSGSVALLIDRAERAAHWTDPKHLRAVGVASLPGSARVFNPDRGEWESAAPVNRVSYLPNGGGWLAGIPASCTGRRREAALDFLKYLTGPEASGRILGDRAFPMLPTRASQLGAGLPDPRSAPGVDPRQWGSAVGDTLTAARTVPGLRIPDASGYLGDVTRARLAALADKSAKNALENAARAWSERTTRLGLKRQRWHYQRSLNHAITSAEPPPR